MSKGMPNTTLPSGFKPYPEFKDSGIAWLGKIPAHWRHLKIKYSTYVKGRIGWQNLRTDEFIDDGPYCITGTDFVEGRVDWDLCYHVSRDRYEQDPFIHVLKGDLLVTKDGSIGKLALVDDLQEPACLNSGIFVTRPLNDRYTSKYLYWVLSSRVFTGFIDYMSAGSTIQHLYQYVFGTFVFPAPSLDEQNAVTAFLDRETARIDAMVAKKERLVELLQEKRTALITHAVTKGLDPAVPMKDSAVEWLDKIPAHWEVKRIKYITECLDGQRIPLNAEQRGVMQGDYPYWGANGIVDYLDKWLFDEELVLLGEDGAPFFERFKDVAFYVNGKLWVNNHAHVLRAVHGMLPQFLSYCLNMVDYRAFIDGTTRDKLTQSDMSNILVQFPPLSEQRAVTNFISRETAKFDALIAKIREGIEKLKEYRTALISAAVTGKIDVREGAA